MKLRTTEDLYDHLSDELAWRKKELAAIRSLVNRNDFTRRKSNAILRSSIALLYAHWEGFCKNSASAYLEFVAMQRMNYNELSRSFIALVVQKKFHSTTSSTNITVYQEVAKFLLDGLDDRSKVPYKNVINTRSNLSSSVFREIVETLGLSYSPFQTKEKLIDERLLKNRNQIAHGDYVLIDQSEFLELYNQVILMMNELKNQIDNAAILKQYRAA